MTKMTKKDLQKVIMLETYRWWNVNELTEVMRDRLKARGMPSINHSSVERNIRHYREPQHFLLVEKRKVSDNTFEYRVTSRAPANHCSANEYRSRK